jgi:hypothetical protein
LRISSAECTNLVWTDLVVAAWLGDLIRLAEQPENLSNGQSWLVETGLLDAVKNGRIEYEVAT